MTPATQAAVEQVLGPRATFVIIRAFEQMDRVENHLKDIGYGPGANQGLSKPVNFSAFRASPPIEDLPYFVYVAHVRELAHRLTTPEPDFSKPTHAEVMAAMYKAWCATPGPDTDYPKFMGQRAIEVMTATFDVVLYIGKLAHNEWQRGTLGTLTRYDVVELEARQAEAREFVRRFFTEDRTHVREAR